MHRKNNPPTFPLFFVIANVLPTTIYYDLPHVANYNNIMLPFAAFVLFHNPKNSGAF